MTRTTRIELREVQSRRSKACSCGAPVQWATTVAGKRICLELGATIEHAGEVLLVSSDDVHWSRCPDATKHRRPRNEAAARATAPAIVGQLERLERSAAELRELLHQVAQRVRAGDTRQQIVELVETRLIDIERKAGPLPDDVYPKTRRFHGD